MQSFRKCGKLVLTVATHMLDQQFYRCTSSRAERGIGRLMSVSIGAHTHTPADPSLRSG
jgi:hypothetical protein